MDTFLTILFWVTQAAMAGLGVYVSLKPQPAEKHKRFIVAFLILFVLGGAINVIQTRRNTAYQEALRQQLDDLRSGQQKTGAGVELLLQRRDKNVQLTPVNPAPSVADTQAKAGARLHIFSGQVFYPGPSKQIYDNVSFQNLGNQRATAEINSMSGIARGADENPAAVRELYSPLNDLVKKGGGLKFTIEPGPPGVWFTIFGPVLSEEVQKKVQTGEYAAYFTAAIVYHDSRGTHRTDYCVYNHIPGLVLMCQKHNEES